MDALRAGHGFVDLSLAVAGKLGGLGAAEARGEVGYKITPGLSAYGYGSAGLQFGGQGGLQGVYGLGAGLRGTF